MTHCTSWDIRKICGYKNVGWTMQQSVGSSGGMLILWDKDMVTITDSLVAEYTISVLCTNKSDNFQWVLTSVYGPTNSVDRSDFWIELDTVCRYWPDLPWCIGGDFNTITKCSAKKNCARITRSMKKLNKFIVEHDLIDLPLKGARYTWSNGQTNPVMCRLDRFLISPSFEQQYPFVTQLAKARPTSDHIPILLDISDPSWGPSPFRFENMWFMENGFLKLLEDWWLSFCFAARRRYNRIRQLYIGNELVTDRGRLQDHIVDYYKTLFSEEEVIRPNLDGILFDSISDADATMLEEDFTRRRLCMQLEIWGMTKLQVRMVFLFFSFKNAGISSRMISWVRCMNSAIQIIAKVLANRLKFVMDKLISPVQCAYIEGRQIIDGTLIANELVDSRIRSKDPGIVCKIDLEKAFDRVNWRYLEFVLVQMGFGRKWCNWLRFSYSSASFSVLINGSSFGYFTSSRGVRQGCPISPLLFIIAMEGFSRFMDRASSQGLFSGFSVSSSSIVVNHLHYADDTIFFLDNKREELHNLFSVLQCFEFIAGLKINNLKTRLIAVGAVHNLPMWAEELGCSVDVLPFMYLGMPLGAKCGSIRIWDPIIEKFDARLSVWRRISLSKGGKLALLKCILSSLPTYYFSLFKAPVSVIKLLEKKMRNFLWEFKEGAKLSHLVNWDIVCAKKERGGLGVCNLKLMNTAMLAKWCWRFGVEKNKLWYKIIADKYGTDYSYWLPGKVNLSYGVSCWRAIADCACYISENSTIFLHSGTNISFWNDCWRGQQPLSCVCPNLFKLIRNKNANVADMISIEGNWKFDFRRVLSNFESQEYAALLTIIGDNPPIRDGLSDTRRWKIHPSGIFTIKSLYSQLVATHGIPNFPSHFTWQHEIPPKICFLMWSLIHGKLNTIDRLQQKGMNIDNNCALCGGGEESQDHIFLHCKVAYKIWCSIIPNTGWCWVVPGSMKTLAEIWFTLFSGNFVWKFIPSAIINSIWRERNCRRFEENYIYKIDDDLIYETKTSILLWAVAAGRRVHLNFSYTVSSNWQALFL
ncbi:uncharacterized protein LOC113326232 [Papaver somniferum]|uniref:uncharacterized protein LOC113326232 n=1 Tax=Papaver somniferum TaxID=3469 RepID=UPI000E7016E9|nr:uncharacterized protein LOC113326232 [Papaver somniferum]